MTEESADRYRVRPGPYRHFKGGQYLAIGTGRHTETGELSVIYRSAGPLHDIDGAHFWIRPEAMFRETVASSGGFPVPRFAPDVIEGAHDDGPLPDVDQLLSFHQAEPATMPAVRAILAAQRIETSRVLATWSDGDPVEVLDATARFLRLLDAADTEIEVALRGR